MECHIESVSLLCGAILKDTMVLQSALLVGKMGTHSC